MRSSRLLGIVLLAFALVAAACGDDDAVVTAAPTAAPAATTPAPAAATTQAPAPTTPEPMAGEGLRMAFILDGGADDGGWNSRHVAGADFVKENLPGVEITIIENIEPGAEAQAAFDDLAADGWNIIVGTTFYMFDAFEVAGDWPDTVFLTWGGFETMANVGHYEGALEEARYLDGMIAGAMTESGIIGYSGGFPIEGTVRPINTFARGVQETNPDAKVIAVFINSWFDPPKEQQAAEALADQGADVIAMDLNSPATAQAATRKGARFIGYGADQSAYAPDAWLTSFIWNWGPYYLSQAEAVLDGSWSAEITYSLMNTGIVTLGPIADDVPQNILDLVEERYQQILNGTFDVMAGPMLDNMGNVVVPAGQTVPPSERTLCCQWLYENVEGEITGGG